MTEPTTPPAGGQSGWTPPGGTPPAGQPASGAPSGWHHEWERSRREGRTGALVGGIILVGIGAIFLLDEFVPGFEIGRLWPLILVAIGIALLIGAFRRA